jgi:enamine deaminase RidA (YjgF/YER057c/UK114 family)
MEVIMGGKEAFQTDKAAVTGGPYAQAIIHNGIMYLSGQGPIDPKTNQVVPGTIEQETELTLENIRIILEEAGSSLSKVLQVTAYLTIWPVQQRIRKALPRKTSCKNLRPSSQAALRHSR